MAHAQVGSLACGQSEAKGNDCQELERITCASALAIGVGVAPLTGGVGLAGAQPGPPCGPHGAAKDPAAVGPAGEPDFHNWGFWFFAAWIPL
jgi:hypothetical protein